MRKAVLTSAALALTILAGSAGIAGTAEAQVTKYKIPDEQGAGQPYPMEIATAPDGSVWFVEFYGNAITQMLPGGRFRRVQADSQQAGLTGVTVDAQGNVWATESVANRIVKLGTNGRLTHYDVPTPNARPGVITVGPDGALWFSEVYGQNIGRLDPATGSIKEFPIVGRPENGIVSDDPYPKGITTGPDGALWFCLGGWNAIGRLTVDGEMSIYPVPTENSGPYRIVTGGDGALWFTELLGGKIGRITTGGAITEFKTPQTVSGPRGIVAGPDGALYYAEGLGKKSIGRITTTGLFSEIAIPVSADEIRSLELVSLYPSDPAGYPQGITFAPDGRIWATDNGTNKILMVDLGSKRGLQVGE